MQSKWYIILVSIAILVVAGIPTFLGDRESAPGQKGITPGQAGTAPGQDGSAPGQGGSEPPELAKTTPGQEGTAPGQAETAPGLCKSDTDGDGTSDCNDLCPDDPLKIEEGACGCGMADIDTDGDSVPDCNDNCPNIANTDQLDTDENGVGDACESPGPGCLPPGYPCDYGYECCSYYCSGGINGKCFVDSDCPGYETGDQVCCNGVCQQSCGPGLNPVPGGGLGTGTCALVAEPSPK